jgi:HD-like signal output (HDOD) protein
MAHNYKMTTTPSDSDRDSDRVAPLIENAILDIGIPPCPAILNQINSEMRKDDPDFKRLTRLINSDVSVAAGLITTANSPFFGSRYHVRSTNEALMKLGLNVASRAIAGIFLRKLFPVSASLERFWDASATIARVSGWLAQQDQVLIKARADDAYTFGLFRDCGIPLLLRRFDHYGAVLVRANKEEERSFTEIEVESCSMNHASIGGLLAQGWWLPEDIYMAIRHHHDYSQLQLDSKSNLSKTTRALIATAQLAEHLFQHHSGLSMTREWFKGGAACLDSLGVTEENLHLLYDESAVLIGADG